MRILNVAFDCVFFHVQLRICYWPWRSDYSVSVYFIPFRDNSNNSNNNEQMQKMNCTGLKGTKGALTAYMNTIKCQHSY